MDDTERRTEEMLKCMGETMYRERIEEFDRIDREALRQMKAEKKKIIYRRLTTVAAVFCIIMISMAALTVTSDAFRCKAFDFLSEEHREYCDFIKNKNDTAAELIVRYPEYIPDGYVLSEEENSEGLNVQHYEGITENEYITVTQMTDEGITLSVDNEYASKEKCLVGICEAYYICDNDSGVLIWDEGGILYEMNSSLGKDEMIKIAESMK